MTRADHTEIACSIARSADVIGDDWTPLILRDVHLGIDTFNELVRDLGISRALLTARPRTLVAGGILHEQPYPERPVRRRYLLPEAGSELIPVLVALMRWGDRRRSPDGAPLVFTHDCGAQLETAVVCIACGDAAHPGTLHPAAGPAGAAAPAPASSPNGSPSSPSPPPARGDPVTLTPPPAHSADDPAGTDGPERLPAALATWMRAGRARDGAATAAVLAPDVVMVSPLTARDRFGGIDLHEAQLLGLDERGDIAGITIFLRPMSAATRRPEALGARIARRQGRRGVAALLTVAGGFLHRVAAAGDRCFLPLAAPPRVRRR